MTLDDVIDLELVRALKHRYCDLCDRARLGEVADLFTEDGVCDLGPLGGTMTGREQVRAGFGGFAAVARPWGTLHRVTNSVLRIDAPGSVSGTWYLHEILLADPQRAGSPLAIGVYHDEYRRVDGTWLIAASKLEVLWSPAH